MVGFVMRKYFIFILLSMLMSPIVATNKDKLKSNGLGLSQEQWEINHNKTGKDIIGIIYDNKYIVVHFGKNVKYIEHQKNISEKQIIKEASKLIPNDAKKVKSYSPKGRSETKVIVYESRYLKNRFKVSEFTNSKPGTFIVQYNKYKNSVGRFIISIGDNP